MQQVMGILEKWNRAMGQAVSWLTLVMVLVTAYNVLSRYLLETGMPWQQELVRFAHAMLFLLAAAYTLADDRHVRVDVWYQHVSPKCKAWVNLCGALFLLIPMAAGVWFFSWEYVLQSWALYEASNEYGGMPGVFLLKSCIWLFALSLMGQGMVIACNAVRVLRGGGDG